MGQRETKHGHMKNAHIFVLAAFFALAMAYGCSEKEQPPTLEEKLQGVWISDFGTLIRTYNFHGGACDAYSIIGGQPYQEYTYACSYEADTLAMIDLAAIWQTGEGVRLAVVTFSDDGNEAVLGWFDGIDYKLKRF